MDPSYHSHDKSIDDPGCSRSPEHPDDAVLHIDGLKQSPSSSNTTHLTIQLSENMQDNSLSQQKLHDLILQLSQSGQLQLKEESKIIIEVKGGQKSSEIEKIKIDPPSCAESTVSTAENQHESQPFISTPVSSGTALKAMISRSSSEYNGTAATHANGAAAVPIPTSSSKVTVVSYQQQQQSIVIPQQSSIKVVGSNTNTTVPFQSYQINPNQPAPTYIIIPTSQLSGNQISLTPSTSTITSDSSSIRLLNQSGQHVILQPSTLKTSPSTSIGSFSLKPATMLSGERNVVVLHQQHHSPAPIVSVRQLTPSHSAPLSHVVGSSSMSGSRLATVSQSAPLLAHNPSGAHGGRMSRGDGYMGPSSVNRESTWQQYVKQFAKLGPCPICGDKISGYHYGIFCCESCKGFFKRTVQNAKRYACHMATPTSLCDITASSRKKCPACRFVKCLEKGMRMEAIRSDRTRGGRSLYPGSRYLRQLAARASGAPNDRVPTTLAAIAPLPSSGISNDSIGLNASSSMQMVPMTLGPNGLPASEDVGGGVYLDPAIVDDSTGAGLSQSQSFAEDEYKHIALSNLSRTIHDVEMPKLLRDILKVEESVEAEPEETLDFESSAHFSEGNLPPNVAEEEAAVYRALLNLADQRLYRIVRWSRALPVFTNLETDDQILLLQNCWADLLCLDCCWKSLPTPTEIRLTSSKCINLDAARDMGANELVGSLLCLTQDLKRLRFGLVDFACLKVILLMQHDLTALRAVRQVKQFQECVSQMLMNYNATNFSDVPNKFAEIFVRIPELQRTSAMARELLADKDLSPYLSSNSLLMELLRSDFHRSNSGLEMSTAAVVGSMHRSTVAMASEDQSICNDVGNTGQPGQPMSADASGFSSPSLQQQQHTGAGRDGGVTVYSCEIPAATRTHSHHASFGIGDQRNRMSDTNGDDV